MKRRMMRFCLSVLAVMLSAFAIPGPVSAHPLGNFTINHLAIVDAGRQRGVINLRYVLDVAEIPTFQIMHDSSDRGNWSQSQLDHWARSEAAIISSGVRVTVDGEQMTLTFRNAQASLRPGAAGLPTLYWVGQFFGQISSGAHDVRVEDQTYADRRIGWKDIIVRPESEPTRELRRYPAELIGSPRHVTSLSFRLKNGMVSSVVATGDVPVAISGSNSIVRSNALSDMFSNSSRAPVFILLTVLVAFGLGALHAIEPGHGKALLAFTLVGSRATVKQAAILAASLTFAHTIGVLILGVVLFFAASFVSESIYAWITLVSGVAVAVIGARNLARYVRSRNLHGHLDGKIHSHDDAAHDHHHGDGVQEHSHAVPGTGPIDFRAAVVAAMSGGVAPCPAAIVVMLAALRLHQIGYGLALIVVFSLGLASVLTALGIAVVHGSSWLARSGKFSRLVTFGPLISACLISIVGAVMVAQGFVAQGVHGSVLIIASLVALAIAGYALTPHHAHTHPAPQS